MSQKKFEWSMVFAALFVPVIVFGFGILIGLFVKGFCWVSEVCR